MVNISYYLICVCVLSRLCMCTYHMISYTFLRVEWSIYFRIFKRFLLRAFGSVSSALTLSVFRGNQGKLVNSMNCWLDLWCVFVHYKSCVPLGETTPNLNQKARTFLAPSRVPTLRCQQFTPSFTYYFCMVDYEFQHVLEIDWVFQHINLYYMYCNESVFHVYPLAKKNWWWNLSVP